MVVRQPFLFVLSILIFGTIAQEGEIGLETGRGNGAVQRCLIDRTTRLAGMRAVRIAAVRSDAENLAEIMADLLFLHIDGAETLDARRIDEPRVRG